jgi:hypothetical protein
MVTQSSIRIIEHESALPLANRPLARCASLDLRQAKRQPAIPGKRMDASLKGGGRDAGDAELSPTLDLVKAQNPRQAAYDTNFAGSS